jgi:membrane dipeptidase
MQIDRRQLLAATAALATLPARAAVTAPPGVSATARDAYARATVIDSLGGPGSQDDQPDHGFSKRSLTDAHASGLTACNVTVSLVGNGADTFEGSIANIAAYNNEIALHPDVFMQIRNAADLKAAKASGRLGLIYGLQDSALIGNSFDRLDTLQALGVKIAQPTYNLRNLAGDGATEPANGGLSRFGYAYLAELNKRRILVDLSHAGQRTIAEGIVASKVSPAITHTGCRALVDHPRNTADAELKALADKGGVAGIYFMPYLRVKGQQMAADVIAHLEHAVQVMGEDHVGLGTDGQISAIDLTPEYRKRYAEDNAQRKKSGIAAPNENDDVYTFAPDLNAPRKFETLADMLIARGWSSARVEKILGGNFARLFSEVWG